MVHPAVPAAVIVVSIIAIWGGCGWAKDWWQQRADRKQYEQYCHEHHHEGQHSQENEWNHDYQHHEESHTTARREEKNTSQRRPFSNRQEEDRSSDIELEELERSIHHRKKILEAEQQRLAEAELEFLRRKQDLQNRMDNIAGATDPFDDKYESFESSMTEVPAPQQEKYQENGDDVFRGLQPEPNHFTLFDSTDHAAVSAPGNPPQKPILPETEIQNLDDEYWADTDNDEDNSLHLRYPKSAQHNSNSDSEESWQGVGSITSSERSRSNSAGSSSFDMLDTSHL
ncbi:uncharacterized protein BYT42DRAFT_553838 [Radiomyces spectabilis]|uniref:uncharacterized protein n=1 Tax=Radiomyces spectabilis TaxID=64574 RepID=UPI00221E3CCE|nr:uncharacterized protein BYT42DRAFT_553838 [Radiomyces spectabilis]KAI8394247.1 hypothetical protein BYT42DRAFT_553838 [Radiomyces spectabilis]